MRVALTTFGCKANQFDTSVLETRLRRKAVSIVDFNDEADFYVINSCAITENAEDEARYMVRKAKRSNPSGVTIVTGCSAQVSAQKLKETEGVDHVLGNNAKDEILSLILEQKEPVFTVDAVIASPQDVAIQNSGLLRRYASRNDEVFFDNIEDFAGHSRAFLKIQDGCNQYCSFCIVPYARGNNRSVPPEKILEALACLKSRNFNEVVLTGIHLGTYGKDLKTSLVSLLRRILSDSSLPQIRLSSIDPEEVGDDLIELLAESDRLCPNLHLPLQSGDDEILHKMRRRYQASLFLNLTEKLSKKIPDISLGTDVIVGFPGETETHFINTMTVLEQAPLHYGHIFSYSDREGTRAYDFQPKTPQRVIDDRSKAARIFMGQKRNSFEEQYIGRTMQGILCRGNGTPFVMTGNYLSVYVNSPQPPLNEVVPLRDILRGGEGSSEQWGSYRDLHKVKITHKTPDGRLNGDILV